MGINALSSCTCAYGGAPVTQQPAPAPEPVVTTPARVARPPHTVVHDFSTHAAPSGFSLQDSTTGTTRTAGASASRAQQILDAVRAAFGGLTWNETLDPPNGKTGGTHRQLTAAQIAAFRRQYPSLPAPKAVMFTQQGGGRVYGVVFGGDDARAIGYGTHHTHGGGAYMQHVWFMNDVQLAFNDVGGREAALRAARA